MTADRGSRARGLVLAVTAVLWGAGMLWAARETILVGGLAEAEVTSTAYALPGAISAALVAGLAVALAVLATRPWGPTARLGLGAGTGLAIGLLAAGSVLLTYPEGWIYAVVAGTVAAAATLGGAVAAIRQPAASAAAAWAGLAVFALGFAMSLASGPLLKLFGGGDTMASQLTALEWFARTQAFAGGLTAALVAFATLRYAHRRGTELRWPLYALAGAGPGLILMISELLARTAGSRVLELAGKVSPEELGAQAFLSDSRFNSALIVTFVGAFLATIAVGRTLKPTPDPALTSPQSPAFPSSPAPASSSRAAASAAGEAPTSAQGGPAQAGDASSGVGSAPEPTGSS
jgi:iron complex transport system permease protein